MDGQCSPFYFGIGLKEENQQLYSGHGHFDECFRHERCNI